MSDVVLVKVIPTYEGDERYVINKRAAKPSRFNFAVPRDVWERYEAARRAFDAASDVIHAITSPGYGETK